MKKTWLDYVILVLQYVALIAVIALVVWCLIHAGDILHIDGGV